MARLYYMSLEGVGAWDKVLKETGAQLRPYHQYIDTARNALQRCRPVLAWRPPSAEERRVFQRRMEERYRRQATRAQQQTRRRNRHAQNAPNGEWVILEPTPERPEEPDDTFESFFEAREFYEEPGCSPGASLKRLEYDREGRALLLERLPSPWQAPTGEEEQEEEQTPPAAIPRLWLRPDTYTLDCQRRALRTLENMPAPRLAPLMRLLSTRPQWEDVELEELAEEDWVFLRPEGTEAQLRDGTEEQREFVELALGTPDFALLEGPPGSGKTTAICELIVQLARRGQRVLLVASTHVAVDNVLERLLQWQDNAAEKLLLPVRIGDEQRVTSDEVVPWIYRNLLRTWKDELLDFLDEPRGGEPAGDPARKVLKDALMREPSLGEESPLVRLLLESANLVCGTTIGILQHPSIKSSRDQLPEPFDFMIIDEASKTPFAEFLVPALHARRWVVIGDMRQLSPYVDEESLADNIRGLVEDPLARAAAHAALASGKIHPPLSSLVAVRGEEARMLEEEARIRGVRYVNLDHPEAVTLRGQQGALPGLLHADLVFGSPEALRAFEHRLPADLQATAGPMPELPDWEAHRRAVRTRTPDEPLDWAREVAWRLVREHELRLNEELELDDKRREGYRTQRQLLMPKSLDGEQLKQLEQKLETLRRVSMPSILELLQRGAGRLPGWDREVALTGGLPEDCLEQRLVSLSFQHRMHPDISHFPREQFYEDEESTLLQDAQGMSKSRDWSYTRYKAGRAVWFDIAPERQRRHRPHAGNINPAEVDTILEELKAFVAWAHGNPRVDREGRKRPWQVAVLSFYRVQEALLRDELRALSGQGGNTRGFQLPRGGDEVHVTLCTVDRFQGHEADIVFLSFVKSGSVGFLDSPNRLNVALTRARYQLVLVGHRTYFASERCKSELLQALASSPHYPNDIGWRSNR